MKYYRSGKQRLYYEKVISLYRDQHMGKTRIAKIIPVSDWTISNWIRTFVAENPQPGNKSFPPWENRSCRAEKLLFLLLFAYFFVPLP